MGRTNNRPGGDGPAHPPGGRSSPTTIQVGSSSVSQPPAIRRQWRHPLAVTIEALPRAWPGSNPVFRLSSTPMVWQMMSAPDIASMCLHAGISREGHPPKAREAWGGMCVGIRYGLAVSR